MSTRITSELERLDMKELSLPSCVNPNKYLSPPFSSLSFLTNAFHQTIVRVDALTEEPARGTDGFCIRAAPNEDGELICVIISDSPFQAFAGYAGNAAGTEKKILRDVFVKGDMYFRTGDLLKKCPDGFLYFGDRLGDTFRWKSENVSTLQVSEALGAVVDEANVYGVLGSYSSLSLSLFFPS